MAIALEMVWLGPSKRSQSSHFPAERKRPWSEDSEKMLQLMMGQFEQHTETLDLLGGCSTTSLTSLELESEKPLPCGWEKCLDLKTGAVYYMNPSSGTKTLSGPREPLRVFSMMQTTAEVIKSGKGVSVSRDDCVKKGVATYLSLRSTKETPETENMFTQFVGEVKCEESLLQAAGSSSHEAKLIDKMQRSGKKDALPSSAEEVVTDDGLELKLKLGTNSASSLKPSAQYDRDWLGGKDILSPASFSPSDMSRVRACSSAGSTSSSHSFLSLQTPDDSAVQSEWRGAAGVGEAESRKTEREDQTMEIVGCPRCLMYVMLCNVDPRCPKCGSSVLLDFPSSTSSKRQRLA